MTALTQARLIEGKAGGGLHNLPIAALAVCFQGGIAIIDAGYLRAGREGQGADDATKAADAANYRAAGVFLYNATGGAADGDVSVDVHEGCFEFGIGTGADALTQVDVGNQVFIIDDQTVGKTNPNDTRTAAGVLEEISNGRAWVRIGLAISASLAA